MPLTTPTTSTTVTALYDDVSPRLFLNLNQNETKVDGLGSQQSVALRRLGQRQGIVLRLGRLRAELKLINGRQHRSIAERAGEGEEGDGQGGRWLALEDYLVADAAVHHVDRVVLVVVDSCPHRPLVRVRREPRGLVVQLGDEVVRAVRTQLDV